MEITREISTEYDNLVKKLLESGTALTDKQARKLNETLMQIERALTLPAGLPGRPWYIHELYAPGFYTGYGVKTLPAVREAIE